MTTTTSSSYATEMSQLPAASEQAPQIPPLAAAETSLSPSPERPTDESTDITTAPQATRKASSAIGPAHPDDDESSAAIAPTVTEGSGPAVLITLLLTTGKRHPYKMDEKYLKKRGVSVEDNDPWNLPVSKMKELILRDWRDDWEEKPAQGPAAIRLISMGLELQEGELLRDKRFNRTGPNIVHMVIKRDIPEDEEMKDGGGKTAPERRGSSACCGCVVQ